LRLMARQSMAYHSAHLLFFFFAQDVAHTDEGYRCLAPESTSRALFSLAGFQVTLIGRFWVTAEASPERT